MRKRFNRFLALLLSVLIAFAAVSDASLAVFSDSSGLGMHIYVSHWHADGTRTLIEIKNFTGSSYESVTRTEYGADGNQIGVADLATDAGISIAGQKLTINAIAKTSENMEAVEFLSGYAISAGQEAVSVINGEPSDYVEVEYLENVHLAKVHVFYSPNPEQVSGVNFTGGELDIEKDPYKDVAWNVDGVYQYAPSDSGVKTYDTSKGLHTDKTATAVGDSGAGTREFEINLESWYADSSYAEVGMVLDASGSMAFVSDGLKPIKVTDPSFKKNTYLYASDLDQILDKTDTDNSKLGYSDYNYYVYDARTQTREFVPLAYWDGTAVTLENVETKKNTAPNNGLIGHYTFDNDQSRLENTAPGGKKAIVVAHVDSDGTYDEEGTEGSLKVSGNDYYTGKEGNAKALDLSRTASNTGGNSAIILDAVPTGDNFTISFAVKKEKDGNPSNKKAESIFTIGTVEGKGGYNLVRGDNTDRLKFGDYAPNGSSKGAYLKSFFSTEYKILTIVVNNGTVKTYVDGKEYGHKSETDFGDGTVSNELTDRRIIFGAYYQQDAFNSSSKVMIDEIYVYDRALDGNEVSQLYKAVTTPSVKSTITGAGISGKEETIIAQAPDGFSGTDANGWYYVSSTSEWSTIKNEQIQTSKSFKPLIGGEVVKNYIDYNSLPNGVQALISKEEVESGNGDGEKYIYTGTENCEFTDKVDNKDKKVYYYDPQTKTVSEWTKAIDENNIALEFGQDSRQKTDDFDSPVIFFIDDAGYLRCFFNNGNSTKPSSDGENSDWRTQCSYVYEKPDNERIKYETLQYALGSFIAELHAASPRSRVSAVRFSTNKIVDAKDSNQLLLLNWTNNPQEATKILSLEAGNRGATSFDTSNGVNQYNYVMTGGTYLYTGLQAYLDNLAESTSKGEDGIAPKKYYCFYGRKRR